MFRRKENRRKAATFYEAEKETPIVIGAEIKRIFVDLPKTFEPFHLILVEVSLDARFALRDQLRVPQGQPSEQEEGPGRDEGLVDDQGSSREEGQDKFFALSFFGDGCREEFVKEDFESEGHDEEAAEHGVKHVEEEVAVVEVADAAVDPRAVMVHLQNAPAQKDALKFITINLCTQVENPGGRFRRFQAIFLREEPTVWALKEGGYPLFWGFIIFL